MKQETFEAVQQDVHDWLHDRREDESQGGTCALWTFFGLRRLRCLGHRAIIQAGSCFWPRVNPEQDDEVMNTHFGYKWDADVAAKWPKMFNRSGHLVMPEIHVWCALPDLATIVDFSVHAFPAQCLKRTGEQWIGNAPPDFFWGTSDDLEKHCACYTPDLDAIRYAINAITNMMGEKL